MPLGMEPGLGPGDIVLDEDPAPHGKGHRSPRFSRPMSVVAKQSPISATAELLLRVDRETYRHAHHNTLHRYPGKVRRQSQTS